MATEVELFNAAVVSALPHGMIVAHAGKTVPDGFLLCNGAAVSRKTYAKLFEAIGELWGAGDGSTTFNLPDSDGRVLQGATDVSKVGKYLEAGLPNITGKWRRGSTEENTVSTDESGIISGVFTGVGTHGSRKHFGNSTYDHPGYPYLSFSAKSGNAVYNSTTVQPPACQTLIIIKV